MDIRNPNRNVFHQGVKTAIQKNLLSGKRPDYVLYETNTDNPLIVIEAKKPHQDFNKAMEQAKNYARAIGAPIAFVTDGIFTKTFHLDKQKPLFLNNEEVDDLIGHDLAVEYLLANEVNTLEEKIIKSRDELIKIFRSLNESFREAGVRAGMDRTELFCNILFLKVISEMSEIDGALIKPVEKTYLWKNFKNKKGRDLLDFINKQAFDYFKRSYGGDVLSKLEEMHKPEILDTVIAKLDDLSLSTINTDIKGDAFEYFLRNYGGADTDFGEYFTPRHIVKPLVKLLNPQYGEKIYDPFCGTGGMLITSFKHIYDRMPRKEQTIKELKRNTIFGGEHSSMVRVAKMNMILTGDGHSNVKQQDSYATPQKGKYDVVITNIPFGRQHKTKYSSLYGYDTPSAEVVGVLHCLDALSDEENARAGIIIPYGILFNQSNAYTNLRKQIIEKHELKSVIELHNHTFTPNTNVNARILIIKKRKDIKQQVVWHFPINNDGFTKDAARRKVEGKNDIDVLLAETNLTIENEDRLKKINFTPLDVQEIKKNKFYNLDLKRQENQQDTKWPIVRLDDIAIILKGKSITKTKTVEGNIPVIAGGQKPAYYHNKSNRTGKVITVSASGAYAGFVNYFETPIFASDCSTIQSKDENKAMTKFIFSVLKNKQEEIYDFQTGTGQPHVYRKDLISFKIPLPPLEIQQAIVKEIEEEERRIEDNKRLIEASEKKVQSFIAKLYD